MSTEARPLQQVTSLDQVIELVNGTHTAPIVRTGADVDWDPVLSKHTQRMKELAKLNLPRETAIPEGFPTHLNVPWAWEGSELKECDYILQLSDVDVKEIDAALANFKCSFFNSHFSDCFGLLMFIPQT
jgi:hypothetical protein